MRRFLFVVGLVVALVLAVSSVAQPFLERDGGRGTVFQAVNDGPLPPYNNWAVLGNIPNLVAVQARVNGNEGRMDFDHCVLEPNQETVCFQGALPGRPEVFIKLIGPRPNGFWWVQISRFTPAEIELWVWKLENGLETGDQVNYYRLAPTRGNGTLPGLEDRTAFTAE